MEIERTKNSKTTNKKRKHSEILFLFKESCPTHSLKNRKLNPQLLKNQPETFHLSNIEKSYIFLQGVVGTEPQEIASSVKRDLRSVKSFLSKINSPNPFTPQHDQKGRWKTGGTKLAERHKAFINRWAKEQTLKSAREAHQRLNRIQNLSPISYNPVRNYMKSLGEFKKPSLKVEVSPINKGKRLKYCFKHQNFNFQRVLFSDESIFQLNANNAKRFHLKGQKPPRKTKFNPNTKIMVWGGISYQGKTTLKVISGTLKSDGYLTILKEKRKQMLDLFKRRKIWFFQQDGAPCHRPKKIKNYIKRWITKRILPHPPQSPDLNPIELIWAQMKRMVEDKRPQSKADLLRAITNSWDLISLQDIRRCIDNVPKKIQKIIENEGEIF